MNNFLNNVKKIRNFFLIKNFYILYFLYFLFKYFFMDSSEKKLRARILATIILRILHIYTLFLLLALLMLNSNIEDGRCWILQIQQEVNNDTYYQEGFCR